jgi:hypothetical protein
MVPMRESQIVGAPREPARGDARPTGGRGDLLGQLNRRGGRDRLETL